MKKFVDIDLGFSDAINYRGNRELKQMFNEVFVKDDKLDSLMQPHTYFLIGEKGTGKTAYATFLENQEYMNTASKSIDINETDFKIFIRLKQYNHLQLSDYERIWKIIILLLLSDCIDKKEIDIFGPKRSELFNDLKRNIDEYYNYAFVPEIANMFRFIQDNTDAANLGIKFPILDFEMNGGVSSEKKNSEERNINQYQNNLLLLERRFYEAFLKLKINKNRFLFIDNIDIHIDNIDFKEYFACLKGLADAVWELNTKLFKAMRDSKGFIKVVLLIRPDILSKINMHNQANKVRDNSVLLDWRVTYDNYRTSSLFNLCERLLQFDNDISQEKSSWDVYFPWYTYPTNSKRDSDDSFVNCLRLSLSRPRDMISIMKAIQDSSRRNGNCDVSRLVDFTSYECENQISNYYIDEAKDWCLYRFSADEFSTLIFFFQFLDGKPRFKYDAYKSIFKEYWDQVDVRKLPIFDEILDPDEFLQLLYELNMICYIDKDRNGKELFRFCYREREIYNLSPQVKLDTTYIVHYALLKALNLGRGAYSDG